LQFGWPKGVTWHTLPMRLVWVIAQVSESRAQYSPQVLGSVVERNEDAGEVHFIFHLMDLNHLLPAGALQRTCV
jgi:hypothetical protein